MTRAGYKMTSGGLIVEDDSHDLSVAVNQGNVTLATSDIEIGAVELKDATSSNRASISADGAVKVDGSAVTQPVSGSLSNGTFSQTFSLDLDAMGGSGVFLTKDCAGYSTLLLEVANVTGSCAVEPAVSNDNATWNGVYLYPLNETGEPDASLTGGLRTAPLDGRYLQLPASGSGTVDVTVHLTSAAYPGFRLGRVIAAINEVGGNQFTANSPVGLQLDGWTEGLAATGGGFVFNPSSAYGQVGVQLSGTWAATVQFEQSNDGSVWVPTLATSVQTGTSATTTTANGLFQMPFPAARGRVNVTAYTSGTVNVTAYAKAVS